MDYSFNITRTWPHKSQVTFLKRSPFTSLSWIPAGQTCEGTAASLLSWVGVGVRWGGGDGRGWFRRWTGREKIWKSAGSPEVKISEPVPEAEDAKVTVLSGFAGYTWEKMSFISYRETLFGVFFLCVLLHGVKFEATVHTADKITPVKYYNPFPFVYLGQSLL